MKVTHYLHKFKLYIGWKLKGLTSRHYRVGKYLLELPPRHTLPYFQAKNKLYDRFLPILAKNLQSEKVIIDVGANVGDTAIMMLEHAKNSIYCIEPSNLYFHYLNKNIKKLTPADLSRVKCVQSIIGTNSFTGELQHQGGTAKLVVNNSTVQEKHIPLDNVFLDHSNVALIKVDTDGYDFDVLLSATKIMAASRPILFWENQINNDTQNTGFNDLYQLLKKLGYMHLYIFDNFGNLLLEETNFDSLTSINSYVTSMNRYDCTRTFYYTDVLATTDEHHSIAQTAIAEYKRDWITV